MSGDREEAEQERLERIAVLETMTRRLAPPADLSLVFREQAAIRSRMIQARERKRIEHEPMLHTREQQTTPHTRGQLVKLQEQLAGLNQRATAALRRGLVTAYREQNHGRVLHPGQRGWEKDGWPLHTVVEKAIVHAIAELKDNRGNPGKVTIASRDAARELVDLYCKCLNSPRPCFDGPAGGKIRNPKALRFAIDCLKAWKVPDAKKLTQKTLIRWI